MIAVFRREWKSFFSRLSGYLFLGILVMLMGIWMLVYNFYYGYTGFEYPLAMLNVSLALLLPLITVGLFQEERRGGVRRFLRMLPLSEGDLILGKYLYLMTILGAVTVGMAICPFLLRMYGEISYAKAYCGVLAFFLIGWAFLSVEFFLSLMIRNQLTLWIVSYCVPIVGVALSYFAKSIPGVFGEVLTNVSLFGAYTPFLYGLLDLRSVSLWISVALIFTALSICFSKRIRKG